VEKAGKIPVLVGKAYKTGLLLGLGWDKKGKKQRLIGILKRTGKKKEGKKFTGKRKT